MAIQVRKRETAPADAQVEVKEAEVVDNGAPDLNVKAPEMNDKFLMASSTFMQKLVEHRRMICLCTGIVIAICLAVIGYFKVVEDGRVEQSSQLTPFLDTLDAPTEAEAQAIEAQRLAQLKAAGISADSDKILEVRLRVPNDEIRYKTIEKRLKTLIPSLADSEIESTAELLLAGTSAKTGNYQDAEAAFNHAGKKSGDIRLFAILGEAQTAMQAKKYDEAIKKYDEAALLNPSFTSYARLSQAKVYEISGQTEMAVETYISVIRDYGYEQDHKVAETRLSVLSADWQSRVGAAVGSQPAQPAI